MIPDGCALVASNSETTTATVIGSKRGSLLASASGKETAVVD